MDKNFYANIRNSMRGSAIEQDLGGDTVSKAMQTFYKDGTPIRDKPKPWQEISKDAAGNPMKNPTTGEVVKQIKPDLGSQMVGNTLNKIGTGGKFALKGGAFGLGGYGAYKGAELSLIHI